MLSYLFTLFPCWTIAGCVVTQRRTFFPHAASLSYYILVIRWTWWRNDPNWIKISVVFASVWRYHTPGVASSGPFGFFYWTVTEKTANRPSFWQFWAVMLDHPKHCPHEDQLGIVKPSIPSGARGHWACFTSADVCIDNRLKSKTGGAARSSDRKGVPLPLSRAKCLQSRSVSVTTEHLSD